MPDEEMDALGKEIVQWAARTHPDYATYIGIHDYDHLLPDPSMAAFKEEVRQLEVYLDRLEMMKAGTLSPDRKIDRQVLIRNMQLNLFEAKVLKIHESYPFAPGDFGGAIMLLFNREFAPLRKRLGSISSRFAAAPEFLEKAKEGMLSPVKMWVDIGIESCNRLPGMIKLIEGIAKKNMSRPGYKKLSEAAAKAGDALADHGRWLKEEMRPKAKDVVGIGATNFERLIKLRGLGLTTDQIYSLGKMYLADGKRRLSEIAPLVKPGATVEEAREIVQSKHPKDFKAALATTVKAMKEAKAFVAKKRLATFPKKEVLDVIETPEYLRHVMPIAAYMPSASFDPIQQGIYMVTPVDKSSDELKKHCTPKTWITAVHEGYPGHHLHNSCAASNPSVARKYQWSIETVEGWALYCEEMMMENGFHDEPDTRFSQTQDLIWRACRVIIDVDLHCGRMTFDEAVSMLVNEAGLDKASATAEIKRYTYTPAYPLSYLMGKHLIKEIKAKARRSWGAKYSDKMFHDTILYAGLIPMDLVREVFEQKPA